MRTKLTLDDKYTIVKLAEGGVPRGEIAEEYDIAIGTVHNLVSEYNVSMQKEVTNEIARAYLCDHKTSRCECVNNTGRNYRSYLEQAGYRKNPRDRDFSL